MKEKRDLKIGIKSDKEFFGELKELAGRIDEGWLPEKTIERLYFDDLCPGTKLTRRLDWWLKLPETQIYWTIDKEKALIAQGLSVLPGLRGEYLQLPLTHTPTTTTGR